MPIHSRRLILLLLMLTINVVLETAEPTFAQEAVSISDIDWNPLGEMIAVANGATVQIIDMSIRELIHTLSNFNRLVTDVKWSPDGTKLAVASGYEVQVWDAVSFESLLTFQDHDFPVSAVAWSPDGSEIASASTWKAQIWDSSAGQLLFTLQGHIQPMTDVSWSPDGIQVATAGRDSAVITWDTTTGQSLSAYVIQDSINPDDPRPAIYSVAWKSDSSLISIAASDGSVRLLDANLQEISILKGHTDSVVSVDWQPNSTQIASGGVDNSVRIWDASTNEQLMTIYTTDVVSSVAWSPDGTQLAYGDGGKLQIIDAPQVPESTPPATHNL